MPTPLLPKLAKTGAMILASSEYVLASTSIAAFCIASIASESVFVFMQMNLLSLTPVAPKSPDLTAKLVR
ncbi:MAG: hypothetical protein WCY41_01980 [Candidatus Micrarchaeia archaeon]